jgi:hypothetical protein
VKELEETSDKCIPSRLALLEKVAVAARKIPNRWSPELEAALRGLKEE